MLSKPYMGKGMSKIRILTDIEIPQCPEWGNATDFLYRSGERRGLGNGLCLLLKLSRDYDVVVTSDIKLAQLFGLLRYILRWRKPKQIVLELMLDEAADDIRLKIKILFQRLCFSSIERIIVSSSNEVINYSRRLKLPEAKFLFIPFHTCVTEPRFVEGAGYILSAGRTERDYGTLAQAVEGLDVKVVVVSDKFNVEGIKFPSNVTVYCDIPYEKYMELLHGCSLVVVPLKKRVKSTGQVVFLEAMALGKPVVATLAIGTEDYIQSEVTGILVPPEDVNALRNAINEYLNNKPMYDRVARNGLQEVQEKYTFTHYTRSLLEEAEKVATLTI